jgi:hypothetical protein
LEVPLGSQPTIPRLFSVHRTGKRPTHRAHRRRLGLFLRQGRERSQSPGRRRDGWELDRAIRGKHPPHPVRGTRLWRFSAICPDSAASLATSLLAMLWLGGIRTHRTTHQGFSLTSSTSPLTDMARTILSISPVRARNYLLYLSLRDWHGSRGCSMYDSASMRDASLDPG